MKAAPLSSFRSCGIVLAAAAGTILLLAGFNFVVDPYGVRANGALLRLPLKSRRSIEKNEYLHKAYALNEERPETIYFGNSRVCVGLPVDEGLWNSKVYNCGLTAAGPEEILAYLRHALNLGGVKRVVLGFDATSFLGAPWTPPSFDAGLLVNRPGGSMRPAFFSAGIFSFNAVSDSLKTVLRQAGTDTVTYRHGVRDGDAMRAKINGDSAWASQRVIEAGRAQMRAIAALDPRQDSVRVARAREMAELCRQHGVEVCVFFPPIHRSFDELLVAEGVRERVAAVQQQIRAAFEDAGLPVLTVRDFSQGYFLAGDRVPEKEGSKVWKWWWEISHFRAELGREIEEELAGASVHAPHGERSAAANSIVVQMP